MKTNRALWTITRAAAASVGVLWLAGACGGATQGVPLVGSESHFLMHCTGSCGGGLECIAGICTKACLTYDDSCEGLAGNAVCTNQSVEPGVLAVCDVDCTSAGDCGSLGAEYGCQGGFCRAPAPGQAPIRDEGDPDSDGSAGGQGPISDEGDPDSDGTAVECAELSDQSPPPVVHGVTLVNTGTTTLYLQSQRRGCSGYEPHYVDVSRLGSGDSFNRIRIDGVGCANLCQDVINNGWTPPDGLPEYEGDLENACAQDCRGPAPVTALAPGETLFEAARIEYAARRLPRACAEGIVTEAINCYQRVLPAQTLYTLSVRVLADQDCDGGPECVTVLLSQPGASWFYEDQTFELNLNP